MKVEFSESKNRATITRGLFVKRAAEVYQNSIDDWYYESTKMECSAWLSWRLDVAKEKSSWIRVRALPVAKVVKE